MSDNTEMQATIDNYHHQLSNKQQLILNLDNVDTPNSLNEELFQLIQNFYKIDVNEVGPTTQDINENIFEEDLSIIVDELVNLYFEEVNKGKERRVKKKFILNYFNIHKINSQEIYNWLLNNQTSSNSIYLLGYFHYNGIETNINKQNALELYQKAAELENIVAQFDLSHIYLFVEKDYDKAFKLSEKLSERKYPCGINRLGYCYKCGIGTDVNVQKAFELFQKAADLGYLHGIFNLGYCYERGIGTYVNRKKAFELYQKVVDLEYLQGINELGRCYKSGIGTDINMQKAFELFQKAADLGYAIAQYNLALMYEYGDGTEKNIDKAIYWYKISAKRGYANAQARLNGILDQ